jgi:hypothetical protein
MPRTIKTANLNSITSRGRLLRGRQPHFEQLFPGIHLGYQRKDASAGRWILRRYLGSGNKYRLIALGLEVVDFNKDSGTIAIRKSKSSKSRHIVLTDEGISFFTSHCAGRAGNEIMFTHLAKLPNQYSKLGHNRGPSLIDKSPWKASEQRRTGEWSSH